MSYADLLVQTCTIQSKSFTLSGVEQVESWTNAATNVPCRKDSTNSPKIQDTEIRVNTDEDLFFFAAGAAVARGRRIVLDGENYDIVKVNKVLGRSAVHHLEVRARFVDHA